MNISKKTLYICFILGFNCFGLSVSHAANPLSLTEAEELALASEPQLQRLQANARALQEQATADGQLPDPKLMVGIKNIPSRSLNMQQDSMTMMEVGLQQAFPPGHTLALQSRRTQAISQAEQHKKTEQTLALLRQIRTLWLEAYYTIHALDIIQHNRALIKQIVTATRVQYSHNQATFTGVLQAQMALTRLDDNATQLKQQLEQLRAALTRYIGEAAYRPLPATLPIWSPLPSHKRLQAQLLNHPLLLIDAANVQAGHEGMALAKEQYKPGFEVGVGYGYRQGHMNDGAPRSDMIGLQVSLDLPVFTASRQDKRFKASAYELEAAELDRHAHYRDLQRDVTSLYAAWQRLDEREAHFTKRLLPEAKQNSQATLRAYQHATDTLTHVLEAYRLQFETELEQLQVQVERAKTRVALQYLEGNAP